MSSKEWLKQLVELAGGLPDSQVELLVNIARMIGRQVVQETLPGSNIATVAFCRSMLTSLLSHHGTSEASLTKVTFEYVFRDACRSDGKKAELVKSRTNPGQDVIVDSVPISLKTEAHKAIRMDALHISKFSECRAIQQLAANDLAGRITVARDGILQHLSRYERIFSLRAHRPDESILYELVEIPKAMFLAVGGVTAAVCSPVTPQGGTTAHIMWNGQHAWTLRLDGSDGKLTFAGIKKSLCTVHVTWRIPVGEAAPSSQQVLLPEA